MYIYMCVWQVCVCVAGVCVCGMCVCAFCLVSRFCWFDHLPGSSNPGALPHPSRTWGLQWVVHPARVPRIQGEHRSNATPRVVPCIPTCQSALCLRWNQWNHQNRQITTTSPDFQRHHILGKVYPALSMLIFIHLCPTTSIDSMNVNQSYPLIFIFIIGYIHSLPIGFHE